MNAGYINIIETRETYSLGMLNNDVSMFHVMLMELKSLRGIIP
jgi:hypothetical protein